MGTNYYAEYNRCSCCDRFDTLHIGKSSAGWSFSFRGYVPDHWGEEPEIPIEREEDWREFLSQEGVVIKDEYGDIIPVEDFWKKVEGKRDSKYNHTITCRNDPRNREHGFRDCWVDEHGNSFSGTEFS